MSHVRHSSVIFTRNCLRPTLVNIVAFSFFLYNISTSEALLKIPSFPVVFLHAFFSSARLRKSETPITNDLFVHVTFTFGLQVLAFFCFKRAKGRKKTGGRSFYVNPQVRSCKRVM